MTNFQSSKSRDLDRLPSCYHKQIIRKPGFNKWVILIYTYKIKVSSGRTKLSHRFIVVKSHLVQTASFHSEQLQYGEHVCQSVSFAEFSPFTTRQRMQAIAKSGKRRTILQEICLRDTWMKVLYRPRTRWLLFFPWILILLISRLGKQKGLNLLYLWLHVL